MAPRLIKKLAEYDQNTIITAIGIVSSLSSDGDGYGACPGPPGRKDTLAERVEYVCLMLELHAERRATRTRPAPEPPPPPSPPPLRQVKDGVIVPEVMPPPPAKDD